jgi:Leucine-rich repeat (LRR) protein
MKTLKGLELSRNKLTGLEGIQFLNSVEEVDLSRNE